MDFRAARIDQHFADQTGINKLTSFLVNFEIDEKHVAEANRLNRLEYERIRDFNYSALQIKWPLQSVLATCEGDANPRNP